LIGKLSYLACQVKLIRQYLTMVLLKLI